MALTGGAVPFLDLWTDPGVDNTTSVGTASDGLLAGGTLSDGVSWWPDSGGTFLTLDATNAVGALGAAAPSLSLSMDGTIDGEACRDLPGLDVSGTVVSGTIATDDALLAPVGFTVDATGAAIAGRVASAAPELTFSLDAYAWADTDISLSMSVTGEAISGTVSTGAPLLDAVDATGEITGPANSFTGAPLLDPLGFSGQALAGSIATLESLLPPLSLEASGLAGGVATATLVLPVIEVSADGFTASVVGSGVIELQLAVTADLHASLGTAGDASDGLSFVAGAAGLTNQAFCLNTTNLALTLYDNYPFNSMARFMGEYVGVSSDGIYALNSETDAGSDIQAVMTTAIMDGKQLAMKRIVQGFVGYSANGPLELRVKTDDNDWNAYVLEETKASGLYRNRVKIGRGTKGNYFQFELRNLNGSQFSIDNMEFPFDVLSRRTS